MPAPESDKTTPKSDKTGANSDKTFTCEVYRNDTYRN